MKAHATSYLSPSVRLCYDCHQPWPCDATQLLIAIRLLLAAEDIHPTMPGICIVDRRDIMRLSALMPEEATDA